MLTAVDDRIKVTAPVNMVSAIMQGGSPCENAPNLRLDTYNVEIAALAAPRPMIIVSSPWDQSRNTPKEEYVVIRGIYSLYGKEHNVENVEVEAQHNYNRDSREAVYRFFGKHLLDETDPGKFQEKPMVIEKPEDMLALHGGKLPENAKNYEEIFRFWRDMAARQAEQTKDIGALKRRLTYSLGVELPSRILSERAGDSLVLSRSEQRDRVPAEWHAGSGAPLLLVHEGGIAAARQTREAQAALAAHRPVLLIDAFQTGSAVAIRDRSHRYFLVFNRSDDANRVQDILTALAYLKKQSREKVELRGVGKAGVWCLFAAAVAGVDLKLQGDLNGFAGKDEDFLRQFFVPGILRAGGLDVAMRLTAAMRN